MNPKALVIALPILKGLFEGGSGSVSPAQPVVTPPPAGKQTLVTSVFDTPAATNGYTDAILRQKQFTQPQVVTPKPITITDPTTGVVVPVRLTDTPSEIARRLKYGSGL